jgi:DNA-binding transcriptional LysR family regulator
LIDATNGSVSPYPGPMELRQLEHFVAVAEERHFTHAAETLRISQSGLSASIRALEVELGAALFVRSTRRVELTAAGRALLVESHRTLASAAAARDAVDAVSGVMAGTLTVGAEQCLGIVDLPRELARFRSRHPAVSIRLTFHGSARLLEQVGTGELDLALIAVCGPTPSGVHLEPLGRVPLVVLSHPEHVVARRETVSIADLEEETFVGFKTDWAARVLTTRAFGAADLAHRVEFEVNDVHTMLDLIGHDLGIAIVPAPIAAKRPGTLHATPLHGDLPEWTVAVAVPDRPNPAAAAFLDLLKDTSPVPRSS